MTWMSQTREDKVAQFNRSGENKTFAEGGNVDTQMNTFIEEVGELIDAIQIHLVEQDGRSRADLCKEWADVQYGLSNLAWFFDIPADPAFNRVHTSNMTKVVEGKVRYRADGKILKPDTYVPADMAGL